MFSCEFYEIFKNTCFIERLWWLLLKKLINIDPLRNSNDIGHSEHLTSEREDNNLTDEIFENC